MANILMGRFFFYAHATIVSNFLNVGLARHDTASFSRDSPHQEVDLPILGKHSSDQPVSTARDADRITNLPGLDFDPGFDQFAGYLTVDGKHQRNLFYWYVESQNDPATDPVVLWTNGGPGCSGLLGFGTEHGPFYFDEDGDISPNPYSWNKIANMLYIEQPAGVGFSYSNEKNDYKTGDSQAASDNYLLILEFFHRFPERKTNPFYIASESYGGHYMPQLTREILNRDVYNRINFKGMMVGNPYVDPYTNTITMFQAWYHHGLLPWPLYDKFYRECRSPKGYTSGRCQKYILDMYGMRGKGINSYALDFPMCLTSDKVSSKSGLHVHKDGRRKQGNSRRLSEDEDDDDDGSLSTQSEELSSQATHLVNYTLKSIAYTSDNPMDQPGFLLPGEHFHPCAEKDWVQYLNRDDVVKAIHADPSTLPWKPCSNKVDYSKKDSLEPQMKVYRTLLSTMNDGSVDLNMLIFSGDDDSVCSLAGTQTWIWDLGVRPDSHRTWLPWLVANQTAGYVTQFRLANAKSSFTFATVHGAGHEVPTYRPMEALELFRRYLSHDWE